MDATDKTLNPVLTQATVDTALLSGPGEYLVAKTIQQLFSIPGFQKIFGKAVLDPKQMQTNNRVANYNRMDWPLRMLPVINIYCSDQEDKTSDNAWLSGAVAFTIYWPAKFRRSDLTDVPLAMKGALENFFASSWVKSMLDPHVSLYNPATVFGLNEYGKQLSWLPNTEGFLEKEQVPVTILKVRYRLDLRAWYRALEQQKRTKADPFDATLVALEGFEGSILGVDEAYDGTPDTVRVEVDLKSNEVTPQ